MPVFAGIVCANTGVTMNAKRKMIAAMKNRRMA
jgi:hypothetical protein